MMIGTPLGGIVSIELSNVFKTFGGYATQEAADWTPLFEHFAFVPCPRYKEASHRWCSSHSL
jgi:hypothetical protein